MMIVSIERDRRLEGIEKAREREKKKTMAESKPICMAVPGLHSLSLCIERRRELAVIHSLYAYREKWQWQPLTPAIHCRLYICIEREKEGCIDRDREIGPDGCLADWLPSRTWKLDWLCHRGRNGRLISEQGRYSQ